MSAQPSTLATYLALIRFDRPIGTYLVLWPALWALWLAAEGIPPLQLVVIFSLGAFFMRSAGCIINDYADRHIDGQVKRTANRPLAQGQLSTKQAISFFVILLLASFALVLMTNLTTIALSIGAVVLASSYPFMKRYTHLPQVVLGAAFAWSIPMAFAAVTNELPPKLWLVYIAVVIWTIAYDTFYAMVDRDDDIKIGVKSTAILFGKDDKLITAFLQGSTLIILLLVGQQFSLNYPYYLSLIFVAALFVYQQRLIKDRQREACFKAFLNNNWVGVLIFIGIVINYVLFPAQ